jgi:hypothetical protein
MCDETGDNEQAAYAPPLPQKSPKLLVFPDDSVPCVHYYVLGSVRYEYRENKIHSVTIRSGSLKPGEFVGMRKDWRENKNGILKYVSSKQAQLLNEKIQVCDCEELKVFMVCRP